MRQAVGDGARRRDVVVERECGAAVVEERADEAHDLIGDLVVAKEVDYSCS